jgi:hypothetical protein
MTLFVVTLSLLVPLGADPSAEETQALSLVLEQTYLKTAEDNDLFVITSTPVDAFTPTTVSCGTNQCTIRVEVSAELSFVPSPPGDPFDFTIVAKALIDGSDQGVAPFSPTMFQAFNATEFLGVASTFSWMKINLTKGFHTVTVQFSRVLNADVGDDVVEALARTLTITTYKPAVRVR